VKQHPLCQVGSHGFQIWLFGTAAWVAFSSGQCLGQATPKASVNPLLLQVQQCIQKETTKKNAAATQDIATRCVLSVAMLNPDGTVRADASDRMTALLRATGATLPKAIVQGQANIALQGLPAQGIFTVPVQIKNQTLSFVLDSGASNSILDTQIAGRLGLKGQPVPSDFLGYLAVGQQFAKQKMMLYRLPTLKVGEAQVSKLFGIGLSTTVLPFKSAGILGLDFLSRFDMILNPQRRSLQLIKSTRPVASGIALEGRLGVMTTPQVYVNSRGPYRFLVDTGASVTSLSEGLAQQLSLKTQLDQNLRVAGLGGQTLARRSQIERLSLQTLQISKLNVLVVNSPVFQTLGIDGIIGQDILNRYVQHWRFGSAGPLGAPETGSLNLTPLSSSTSVNGYIGSEIRTR
jgi:predicted aspartyl protease